MFALVLAPAAAEFIRKPGSCDAPVGSDATFECEVDGEPEPEVKWYRDGIELYDGIKYRLQRDGNLARLVVKNVTSSDSGDITCEVRNRKGGDTAVVKLKAQAPPTFDRDLRDQEVDKGEMLKLKIPFTGSGPISAKLRKSGLDVPDNSRIKVTAFDDYVIVQINEADVTDAGKYSLELGNKSGSSALPFNVRVKGEIDAII